jgi:hypothetical protein
MPSAKPDPFFSAGARLERRAAHDRIVRRIKYYERLQQSGSVAAANCDGAISALKAELAWNTTRWQRYSKRAGGLGK